MQISWVGMTRDHFEPGEAGRIRMLVIHATAGRAPGDLDWLRRGGSDQRPVSIHYYIDKQGNICQLVHDKDIAWHAGISRWVVDGREVAGCNAVSLGIELENLNDGSDLYPTAQYEAALWLARRLTQQYRIPRGQLVRHIDIAPGRKTDPAGFAWARFVAEVYSAEQAPAGALELPDGPLRGLLLDLAFRAAGGAAPAHWPMLDAARALDLGMPVRAISTREAVGPARPRLLAGAAQDDLARPLMVGGQSLILEAYARDLLYAPPERLSEVKRLGTTPAGPLRDELLQALFRAADPVSGFQPGWAFHQFYLKHAAAIGVPLGPSHRIVRPAGDGRDYACQHYALDSLCSPVGQWRTIIRLSELVRAGDGSGVAAGLPAETARRLRAALLDDLYRSRSGRAFDRSALLCRAALDRGIGAPLGDAQREQFGDAALLAMPFALDVLYCRAPQEASAADSAPLLSTLRDARLGDEVLIASLSDLLAAAPPLLLGVNGDAPAALPPASGGQLLGARSAEPAVYDLTLHLGYGEPRALGSPDMIVVYPVAGPAHADLRAAVGASRPRWHYYIDFAGTVTRLADEQQAATAADSVLWNGWGEINRRSLAVAVEGGASGLTSRQARALGWLLRRLMQRFSLGREQILTTASWFRQAQPQRSKEGVRA